MDGAAVMEISRDALITLLAVAGPILMIGLAVGLVVSVIQTITQIQEMTLTFVPKILIVFASLLILLPSMGTQLGDLMTRLMDRVIQGG